MTPKKEKGVLLKKPVYKTTGKRNRFEINISKGLGPSSKSAKTSGSPGISGKGTGFSKEHATLSSKKKGL